MFSGIACNKDEFHCVSSKTCIHVDKKCDNTPDCPNGEDELDCFLLTDGTTVRLDTDFRPHLNSKGIISFYYQDSWWPMCGENWTDIHSTIATELCWSLGFADSELYSEVEIKNHPLRIVVNQETEDVSMENADSTEVCNGLYVECSNVSMRNWYPKIGNNENILPWDVAIFVDGDYKCTGVLLNMKWVLTSYNCFRGISELNSHYVVVLLGIGDRYVDIAGPHEQIRLVDESIPVLYSDIILLKLQTEVANTRYVKPVHFTQGNEIYRFKEICYAVGRTKHNKLTSIELIRTMNCTSGSRCFKRSQPIFEECNNPRAQRWSGVIVCESGNGIYPSAVFFQEHGACGFQRTTAFTSLSLFVNAIFDIFDCAKDQLTCGSGRCVSKSAFCNKINDCEDGSDEPDVCSCVSYLTLTNPERICDGVRHCYDRTDEDPERCQCDIGRFMCAQTKFCIPMEMVCDGYSDCPNGEDEHNCIKLRKLNNNPNVGEVISRTAGVWHQGCFNKNVPQEELQDICNRLGFINTIGIGHFKYMNEVERFAKKPVLEPFNVVWINRNENVQFRLAIRNGDTPSLSFVNSTDCYRLFIECK
ncbi:low-density lipoprotein receptor-related [Holotrichia oblita]|uniref:Low-density lipoprotein receptor-related n=1 Tax=Holotrichia oblita TaxID=644536 RepID=A0ACB9SZ31_HOLOL|nr:low-density lipoprotein receptor-related [Holotrichia oblita]